MVNASAVIGYAILGLAVLAAGFIPSFIAMYKKNTNAMQVYKANALAILCPGVLGLGLSLLFQTLGVNKEIWALVILIAIELVRIAAWVYLLVMTIKDKQLPIF